MKPNRNYITPFISLIFFVLGISGIVHTLEDIWTNNDTNIMEVFDLITDN